MAFVDRTQFAAQEGATLDIYQLVERIGRGGEADVWSAWDTVARRVVAIKVVLTTDSRPATGSSRIEFSREAHLVTRLRHPHIVPLYDYGERPGLRYLTMRFMVGGSLSDVIHRGALPPADFARLAVPIADSLDFIHSNAIVHRDLKPGNVLLDSRRTPCLSDFGLAREVALDSTLPIHSARGTLPYMSPEQWRGERILPQSDLYSLGIMFFEMLTGALPFEGRFALAIAQREQGLNLPDPASVVPGLPLSLHVPLLKLTAETPDKRPKLAGELVRAMVASLNLSTPVKVVPPVAATPEEEERAALTADAAALLSTGLRAWTVEPAQFPLNLTRFLFVASAPLPEGALPAAAHRLLLEGTLRFRRRTLDISEFDPRRWWERAAEADKRACCHALIAEAGEAGDDGLLSRVLELALELPPEPLPAGVKTHLAGAARAEKSILSERALRLLARDEPPPAEGWLETSELDGLLADLAAGQGALRHEAGELILATRRAGALRRMLASPDPRRGVALLRETLAATRRLPPGTPPLLSLRVILDTGVRQFFFHPRQLLFDYLSISISCAVALGVIVYLTYRAPDFLNAARALNALGIGLLFGLQIGLGAFLAYSITRRLKVIAPGLRLAFAITAGGLVAAWGFGNYHILYNQIAPDSPLILPGGLVFVAGFALAGLASDTASKLVAIWCTVFTAVIVTWELHLQTGDIPLMYFEYDAEPTAYALTVTFSILVALGSVLRDAVMGILHSRARIGEK
ncbi:MAG: serine/threonine protein kinase [Anaerolineae bacterium]|nr:serine/threonine protein kinase [Anaerolineae bacterium]